MSSALSKLLDKAFVLGFVLPAIFGLTAFTGLFGCPSLICSPSPDVMQSPFAQLSYAVLAVYVLAIVLSAVNYSLYRVFRGDVGPLLWFPAANRHQRRKRAVLHKAIRKAGKSSRGDVLAWRMRERFPSLIGPLLPTAFGNAQRAFEMYPAQTYGVDPISAYPRLMSVVPQAYQTLIDEAKALVDLFLNLSVLSISMFAFSIANAGLALIGMKSQLPTPNFWGGWLGLACISVLIAVSAYKCSIGLIPAWGDWVKAAFDCYLPALSKQLGYSMPSNALERRAVWGDLSRQMLYGKTFDPPYSACVSVDDE